MFVGDSDAENGDDEPGDAEVGAADRAADIAADGSAAGGTPVGGVTPGRVAEALATARAAMAEVLAADHAEFVDANLTELVVELCELVEQASAAQVLAVGAWAPRKTFLADGFGSARSWLAARTSMGSPAAGRVAATGRFVQDHDGVAAGLRGGGLPVASVAAMSINGSGARAELFDRDEETLVGHAGSLPVDEFTRVMRRWRALADDDLADGDADTAHHVRSTHGSFVGANGYRLDANLEASDGAIIDAALRHAMPGPDPEGFAGGQRTAEQRRADGLVDIFRTYLNQVNAKTENGKRVAAPVATVGVRVDWEILTGSSDDLFDPTLWSDLMSGYPVGRETVRRLMCGCWAARVVTRGKSSAIDLGDNARYFSAAQRLALIARDGDTCVVPGCTMPVERCEAHHLDPYHKGGPTDLDNGAHLCGFHHHKVHEGHWRLQRDPDGRWEMLPPAHRAPPPRSDAAPPRTATGPPG